MTGQILVIFSGERLAQNFADDWPTFSDTRLELFPTVTQTRPEDMSADPGFGQRLRVLKEVSSSANPPFLIATSVQAISHPVAAPDLISASEYGINVGQPLDFIKFKKWLVENSYQTTTSVQMPGEFSARGGSSMCLHRIGLCRQESNCSIPKLNRYVFLIQPPNEVLRNAAG